MRETGLTSPIQLASDTPVAAPPVPDSVYETRVTLVEHHTDRLFRFRVTRPAGFRFRSGEFVMIGLPSPKPVYRAYSIASPSWDDQIEFFSIKVPDGVLTSKLQKIRDGDAIWVRKKSTGTLVLDALLPGRRLFTFSTGTGIAPFASLIRDPECYEKFDRVILTHTCRNVAELQYGKDTYARVCGDPLVGEAAKKALVHFDTATREPYDRMGRITRLIEDGRLFTDLGIPPFDPEHDRVMLCGSTAMITDLKSMMLDRGFVEGSNSKPGSFVLERAFVD